MGRFMIGREWRILGALAVGLLMTAGTMAMAGGHPGGHGGGRPPRASAPQHAYRPPKMPHVAPARVNVARPHPAANHPTARAAHQPNRNVHPGASGRGVSAATAGTANRTRAVPTHARNRAGATIAGNAVAPQGTLAGHPSNRYTYGHSTGARPYRAYGYGRGYRNRYYGHGYGYGRSQGLSRGIVSRLRSVYRNLAQVDRDYQGHRVRAIRHVALAIRQFSYGSMGSGYAGSAPGMSNRLVMGAGMVPGAGVRRSALINGGQGGQNRQPMSQQQSNARMGQALRNLQGIRMQLVNQGYGTMGQVRATGHIQHAIRELNVALSIR